jgi:hypothetical protein
LVRCHHKLVIFQPCWGRLGYQKTWDPESEASKASLPLPVNELYEPQGRENTLPASEPEKGPWQQVSAGAMFAGEGMLQK